MSTVFANTNRVLPLSRLLLIFFYRRSVGFLLCIYCLFQATLASASANMGMTHRNNIASLFAQLQNTPKGGRASKRLSYRVSAPESFNSARSAYSYSNYDIEKNAPLVAEDSVSNSIKKKTLQHIFRAPTISLNAGITQAFQSADEGDLSTKVNSHNFGLSVSYLYQVLQRVRLGAEIMHSTFNSTGVNDALSILAKTELTLYKNKHVDLYLVSGVGLSFDTFNMLDAISMIAKQDVSGKDTIYNDAFNFTPVYNGSQVPDSTALFYCSYGSRMTFYHGLSDTNPQDNSNISVFNGRGFGICFHAAKGSEAVYTYKKVVTTLTTSMNMVTIPWFIGVGADYNLEPLVNLIKSFSNLTVDEEDKPLNHELGLSLGMRYFNNGSGRAQLKTSYSQGYVYMQYPGFYSFNVGLYYKL